VTPRTRLTIAAAVAAAALWFATVRLPLPARAFTIFLAVPLPIIAVLQLRSLAGLTLEELPRIPVYLSSALTLWALAIAAILAAQYSGFTPALIGLRTLRPDIFVAWVIVGIGSAALLAAAGKLLGVSESPLLLHLLPDTAGERSAFVGLSLSAGICEEIVFRGFLLAALLPVLGNTLGAVLVSSFLFGVLHAYQSIFGVVRATLLGCALALPFVLAGSIYPAMFAHALIDVVGGLWLAKRWAE
jgi:membrane protease YdiL (CAAX protease family)